MRFLAVLLLAVSTAPAQTFAPRFTPLISGLDAPTVITHAGDGSGRLFIAERPGRIRIVRDGELLARPFLDITARVLEGGGASSERGFLGVAFHPDFAENGYFFVNYTAVSQGGGTIVSRFQVSPDDPDLALRDSETVFLTVAQPFGNHNGGQLAFGPDGYLYIGLGDGGSANDPMNNGQDLGELLGKLLRVDVDEGAPVRPASGNPFLARPGARGEIWAYGLRNPWRFSFDRATGDLYIADVGQASVEEIDFQPAASAGGENYGWRRMEGRDCFIPGGTGCNADGSLVEPVLQYRHVAGRCSVTGGYVYRGARYPAHRGLYFFGDFCTGEVWAGIEQNDVWQALGPAPSGRNILTFGEDEAGELYLGALSGEVLRVEGPEPALRLGDGGAVNGASFTSGPLAPGAVAAIFGEGLAPADVVADALPLPADLGGLELVFDATPAPAFFVSPGQANVVLPWELLGAGAVTLQARRGDRTSNVLQLELAPVSPGIFTLDQSGNGPAAALRGATVPDAVSAGDVLSLFVTGLGDVTNRPASGAAAPVDPLAEVLSPVTVTVGGVPARILFAGLAPGFVGLYQINLEIAGDPPTGEVDIVVTVEGVASNAATVVIE